VIEGGVVSEFVMTNEQFPVLFALSVAWQSTGVAPSAAMVSGDVWLQTTEPLMPDSSEAVAANVAVDVVEAPVLGETVNEVGHVTIGGAASTTEREMKHVAELLA